MAQAVTAREAIGAAKREPTNANIVEAIERMCDSLEGIGTRLDRVESRLDALETKVDGLEAKIDDVHVYVIQDAR